ncbi:MAG TPA: hypothetical protein VF176_05905 [Solirubrobacterales bacterium]
MRALAAGLATMAVLVAAMAPQAARAEFALVPGSFDVSAVDGGGQPELRAGAHPDRLLTTFEFLNDGGGDDGNVKDLVLDFSPGLIGDPTAVPTCPRSALFTSACPEESQVGVARLTFALFGAQDIPLYNLAPQENEVAEFAGMFIFAPIRLFSTVRADGDFGTRIELRDINQNLPLFASDVELWGVPADHQTGTAIPRRPFLTNATRCGEPPTTTIRARSWQQRENWISATSAPPGPLTGCEDPPFDPGFGLTLDSPDADSPTGALIELTVPQNDDADARATSHLREVAITLPEGMSLSPSVAEGLTACDEDQLGIGSTRAPACPESSKIGSIEVVSPILANPLEGDAFFGRQTGEGRFQLLLAIPGPGFWMKLLGSIQADPQTGQVTAVLRDLPQFPLARIGLRFKGGPRAPLTTPPSCGIGAARAQLTPYRGTPDVTVTAPAAITSGPGGGTCLLAAPFAPTFAAGSSPALAGDDSAFFLTVRRPDGHEPIERLRFELPLGLTARLAGVERCPMQVAMAAACSAASRIGSVAVEAGAGPSPLPLSGEVYLTGPYRGAPFGIALTVHGNAGPIDLGTIVVPATLGVDPLDGHMTLETDALPQIVGGIPLRLQTLGVDIDRPGFMVNPTSCREGRINVSIRGAIATTTEPTVPYSLRGCERLRFRPTVSVALMDRRELHLGGNPDLEIALHPRAGHANVRTVSIALPRALRLNQTASSVICSREEGLDDRCPSGSSVGWARVRTPLLSQELTGPVHIVQPRGNGTPDLWTTVSGGGVKMTLRGTTTNRRNHPLRASFAGLPDLPLSEFSFRLRGDHQGLLSLVEGLCRRGAPRRLSAHSEIQGQNDARSLGVVRVHANPRCGRR